MMMVMMMMNDLAKRANRLLFNILFVVQNMGWLNEQAMFDQTSNKVSPHNAFGVLPLKLWCDFN